ncbi:MAG: PD-(D/E)XK nuclease family protein, partial [Lachnospiraceae bacterium]|nr:PD-(D/E)XK nuclease family protein [Lachnospiraceae bacterium]
SWIGRIAGKRPDAAEGGAGTAVYSPDAPDSGAGTAGSVPVQEGDPGRAPGLSAPSQAEGNALTVSDRIDALEAFLEAIGARDTLLAAAEELEAAGRYADAREYRQLPDGILGLFDEIRGILGDRALGDEEFREVLQTGIDRTGVGIAPPTMDCVTVGDLLRTRLDDVKVLFVAGANEGALPAYGNAAGLITDRDREILSEHGVTLSPTAKQEGFFARYYIYMLFTKPSERLVLSWSLTGRDGKPQDPAYPAAELAALFPDAVPETVDESRLMAETAGEAWEQAASGLRAYKDLVFGHTPQKAERMLAESAGGPLEAACSWAHGTPGNEARFRFVRDLLDYRLASEKLDPVLAGRLYGPVLGGSVTRFQYFAACAYRHFAQFGLALEERAVHRVGGEDLGTLYHESLHCFFEKADARGLEWHRLEEADRKALVEESVLEAAQKFGNRLFSDSARNRALITRAVRITDRTVRTLARQWEEGDYDTVRTEVPFRFLRELRDSGQMTALRLKGRIDRVDTALSEDGRRVYVKVIDYKTGYEKLDYTDIYYGTKLQLPLYLDSVLQMEQTARPDAEIIPAGIYYYRIADPVVEDVEGQDPEEQIYKALRMNGLTENMCGSPERIDRDIAETRESSVVEALKLNKDGGFDKRSKTASPEELEKLRRFAVRKAERIAKEIAEGEISVNPFGDRGRPEPCGYCPYRTLCHIGDGIPGITLRKKTEKDLADLTGEADG